MTARVLVVDDIHANVKLLTARLSAEYFETLTAYSGKDALDICARERVDVVLLDVMMPGMDGFEVCRRIKQNPKTAHVPVIMVTALDQPSDKVQGLDAGADDFLAKPVDDIALITRVKNLARMKVLNDELMLRAATIHDMGLSAPAVGIKLPEIEERGRIVLVEDHARSAARMVEVLARCHSVTVEEEPHAGLLRIAEEGCDLLIVSLNLANADGLRLCSQVRSLDRMRHLPIIVVVEPHEEARLLRALDMGVNDYLVRPIDRAEMLARVRTQIRRKRQVDILRVNLERSVELAIIDPLTGLHNRRYFEEHLKTLAARALDLRQPLSLLIADIDHFKSINDRHGHDVGDVVLREFALRFRGNTRGIDLTCRFGGEEFVCVMPDTDLAGAAHVAERLRIGVASEAFRVGPTTEVCITVSIGLAALGSADDTAEALFRRADQALYAAKHEGRNRVAGRAA
ncbi:MAG TPA: PleD family two-component system response regulator [Hyphomicrobiaceae bacterium]|nr:PleD family two-component system response regulator [Hyphomicrobiaceae bacterium]